MSDKPKVVAWMVNCTPFAKESQADIYRADHQHKQPLIRLSDHESIVAPLLKRARAAERESMSHMKTLRGLERVSRVVADHSDEVNVENNLLRQDRAADKARIEELENLLIDISDGCTQRNMPSESKISSWADAIDAALAQQGKGGVE